MNVELSAELSQFLEEAQRALQAGRIGTLVSARVLISEPSAEDDSSMTSLPLVEQLSSLFAAEVDDLKTQGTKTGNHETALATFGDGTTLILSYTRSPNSPISLDALLLGTQGSIQYQGG